MGLKMIISLSFLFFSATACGKKQDIQAYKCALGDCIQSSHDQPNGNKLCMVNFRSFELALQNCEIYKCDKIARYDFHGTDRFEILSKTNEIDNLCATITSVIKLENPESSNRKRRSSQITSVLNIHDHGDRSFQQKQFFYPEENITEIIVDAHKEFEKNTFFLLPNLGLKISVIGDHTCILADINAYKIDDVEEEFITENAENDSRKNNTIEFEWSSGYKRSDFNLHNLPSRVQEKCADLDILELEYLFRGTKQGGSTVDAKAMILPSVEHSRHARNTNVQIAIVNKD